MSLSSLFFLIEQENVSEPKLFTGTTPRSLHRDLFHFENVIFLKLHCTCSQSQAEYLQCWDSYNYSFNQADSFIIYLAIALCSRLWDHSEFLEIEFNFYTYPVINNQLFTVQNHGNWNRRLFLITLWQT